MCVGVWCASGLLARFEVKEKKGEKENLFIIYFIENKPFD